MSEKLYTEKELLYPALEVINENGGSAKTTFIIEQLIEKLQPSEKDLEILFGRNDSRFSQKVRNLISHKTITRYADHDPIEHSLTINEKGIYFLENADSGDFEVAFDDFEGEEDLNDIDNLDVENMGELVQVDTLNKSVFELKRKYDKSITEKNIMNGLILDESFQRTGLVWSDGQKSKLIESILLGIPLPVFYLAEDKNNNLIVIDGRQRLTALFEFLNGKYSLKGLEFLKDLNGKKIHDFDGELSLLKAKIEDTPLYVNKIRATTPEFLKLQIFARINKQGTQLNSQEMRHALHQGEITFLLGELSDSLDISVNKSRMKDRYLLLRYISLRLYYKQELYNYRKRVSVEYTDINDFLGKSMDAINTFTGEQLDVIKTDVIDTLEVSKRVFGEYVFRLKEGNPINMILFELTMLLVSLTKDRLSDSDIRELLFRYMEIDINDNSVSNQADLTTETPFEQNIKYHRDSKENFIQRINWMHEVVEDEND